MGWARSSVKVLLGGQRFSQRPQNIPIQHGKHLRRFTVTLNKSVEHIEGTIWCHGAEHMGTNVSLRGWQRLRKEQKRISSASIESTSGPVVTPR